MTYATALDMIGYFSAEELAQRLDVSVPRLVTAEMLTIAAKAGDMSGFAQEEQDATAAALAAAALTLEGAEEQVNAYLASRYKLPLATVPAILKKYEADIARYDLYDDQVTDAVKNRFEQAMKFLRAAAKGEVTLGLDMSGTEVQAQDTVEVVSDGRVFGRANARDFI